ncbi:MAG: hypothetical protein WBW02_00985, partial [Candidatus Sulfotelmatobacter sp.]
SKDSVLRHRRHIDNAIRAAQVIKSTGFQELTAAIERLTAKMQRHLSSPRRSETWFQESRELRGWVTLRSKLAGKVVVGESEGRRQGDTYNIVFRGPDGEPLKIPLKVYERLPAELFAESESASAYQPNAPVTSAEDQAVTG